MTDLIWSFAPWLVFLLAERVTSLYGAVAAAAAAALIVLIRAIRRKRVHMLDIASTVYFAALGTTLLAVHPGHLEYWSRYAQAGSHIALTLLVFGSILIGLPFTESYARETTPEPAWHTRRFHALNRQISTIWGLAFLVGTISLIAAGSVESRQVLLRIIVPFGSLYYAYVYTVKHTKEVRQTTAQQAEQDVSQTATEQGKKISRRSDHAGSLGA
jgi:Ca2+/Na+ antiporter